MPRHVLLGSKLLLLFSLRTFAIRNLEIASPLQVFTVLQSTSNTTATNYRQDFLNKFKVGLKAEHEARQEIADKKPPTGEGDDWAVQAAIQDRKQRQLENRVAEAAYEKAIADYEQNKQNNKAAAKNSDYQFVGVVNKDNDAVPITWYARKRANNSPWSVRIVHVNQQAVLYDLFKQGKIDIFAKYAKAAGSNKTAKQYFVREKSWRTLWNFSPKHFITDSSGAYWRERRLQPGLYTDGENVFEATYRYKDGRNGMRRRSTLQQWLSSPSVDVQEKAKLQNRLLTSEPDVVLEE